MLAKSKKVPVSERALLARINRKLSANDQAIRKCKRDAKGYDFLGDFYLVDVSKNNVVDTQLDLQSFGQKIGSLQAFEELDG